jgi:methylmalonyl-CoA mutase N-terminal domain/subunit
MGESKENKPRRDKPSRDKPWIFRTYAGHSTAEKSNALYRQNLSKGQTGLSIAFDLPTQTGYDSDHPLAKGEVGKVGVPVSHLGDMRTLLSGIPLAEMNTSMTINAPAAWLLSLYIAAADETGAPRTSLTGTTQNDIIKEYLSRGTYVFPARPIHASDQGHDPVHDEGNAEMESDECLLLSPAGSGCDAGAGTRLRARHRDRDPRHGEEFGRGARRQDG